MAADRDVVEESCLADIASKCHLRTVDIGVLDQRIEIDRVSIDRIVRNEQVQRAGIVVDR